MNNTYFGANLVDKNTISVFLFSPIQKNDQTPINLIINDSIVVPLEVTKQVFLNGVSLYTCRYSHGFKLGNSYIVSIENYGLAGLNVNEAINFPDFDDEFYYGDDDLGVTYTKKETTFKIWAPLSSNVGVLLKTDEDEDYVVYYMKREPRGVFSLTLKGDYEGYHYLFLLKTNEITYRSLDPYGKACSANSVDNIVVDFNKTKIDLCEDDLPTYNSYLDTIIYELDIRDFTIDEHTNIVNKGKYLGLTEKGRKTDGKNPAGLDYLESLGVTHVQILPMYDFKTIDELHPENSYNWGYDPWQYFCPEGSYSTNPNDPYSRIIELKEMIAALHKKGIKVNMDVVYNHYYDTLMNCLSRVVPGYYARTRKNGILSNGSGCGNDFNSERPMARKLILDCVKFWVKEYGIDGLRFDLMGLLDITTILRIKKVCRAIKPDFMVYGEGWDMNTELSSDKKASILNSYKLDEVAFFNDTYRDILKGANGVDNLRSGGYLTGNLSYVDGFKFCFLSSSVNFVYPARFKSPEQSINYVECHDNFTLFDKVSSVYGKENVEKALEVINEINATILLSHGVPFFHAGQEIGLSKKYEDNTYNKGDEYNKFSWDVLDQRINMVKYFKSMVDFRKTRYIANILDTKAISESTKFNNLDGGLLGIEVKLSTGEFYILINPTDNNIRHTFNDYVLVECAEAGYLKNSELYIKTLTSTAHSVTVVSKKVS